VQDPGYRIGDHPSDLELWVWGRDRKELFINAARGMLNYTAPSGGAGPPLRRRVHLTASNQEELLIAWLNELLFFLETGEERYRSFLITGLSDRELQAKLEGVKLRPEERLGPEIKGATYHQLFIRKTESGWKAHIILDL